MGYNTTVMLLNDKMGDWPNEIRNAARMWERFDVRRNDHLSSGRFRYGEVVSCEHATDAQVCVIGQNCGRYLTPVTQVQQPADLEKLVEVLRGHGYSVKAPNQKRAMPPLKWGFSARSGES